MKNFCIIDLGTNTFNMLIADPAGQRVYSEKIAVKLGKDGINKGIITDEAFERAIQAMMYFKEKATREDAGQIVAIATSAVRNASNGQKLMYEIFQKTGVRVKVISGLEEAELIYKGVRAALSLGEDISLIIDIGGGSVEFILGDHQRMYWSQSFEIGAQRLYDLFHTSDPIPPSRVDALNEYLETKLQPLFTATLLHRPIVLVGSSGTFDTLAEIDWIKKGGPLNSNTPTEYLLAQPDYQSIAEEIIAKPREARMNIPGMIDMRVDMVVVACVLINFIKKRLNLRDIRVSSYALKEGVLYSML